MPGPRSKYPIELTETQVTQLRHLSLSYSAPYAEVQRARILLLAHQQPTWPNSQVAHTVGCAADTVKEWRRRWRQQGTLQATARAGAPRPFPALGRAQIVALACSKPSAHGKVWKRWSGEKRAQVAVERGIVSTISPSTIRRWLRQDKLKPWRYHSWPHSTDPQFVEKATPVLDLYEAAPQLATQQEEGCCADEKTSIQARQRLHETKAALPSSPLQVADRYRRMGAVQLFCALLVASGRTFTCCFARRCFADFQAFLHALFASALCLGLKVLHLILDNGPTHAPKQLATWSASLDLAFEVRLYWLPTYASWLDQVEIIFSKVQRDLLTPNDFPSIVALERDLQVYFAELNKYPKPIKWTYTKTKLLAKFGAPPPAQLAA
jgi:transposase